MFDIITKQEHWSWIEHGPLEAPGSSPGFVQKIIHRVRSIYQPQRPYELKDVQDAFIVHRLTGTQHSKILEVGGGNPRILQQFALDNECWLLDKFEGVGRGPQQAPHVRNIHVVLGYMGDFTPQLQDNSFDILYSISVLEHVSLDKLEAFFADCARVLKCGGRMLHAIDTYAFDDPQDALNQPFKQRIKAYLQFASRPDIGIKLVEPPQIDENVKFSCSYASLPDNVMHEWYQRRRNDKRLHGQVVSIRSEWEKQ